MKKLIILILILTIISSVNALAGRLGLDLNLDLGSGIITSFDPGDALLLESGDYLLLESGDKLLLE
jgi:hypothetical protein